MALRSRTRLQLRRTVVVAALGALFVPAVADAKTKTPVITKVTPQIGSVGTKLTVIVPKTLEKYMLVQGKTPIPTRFKLRVLASKLSKSYTPAKLSPVIG